MPVADPDREETFVVCVIRSDIADARAPKEAILREAERHGFSEDDVFALKLSLEEAVSNAIKHGNQSDSEKLVTIRYAVDDKKAAVIVADEGRGFLPEQLPDCTVPERLSVPSGRGVMLMKAYMDKVCYRDNGREVYFVKLRSRGGPSAGADQTAD
ncbi:MAG: ATP-binding protein [Phycisphaerae bacterium]|nr:ATP-binding protein [Phycisphaerae bacterium]